MKHDDQYLIKIGDLVSLHSPEDDDPDEIVTIGVVTEVFGSYFRAHYTYKVLNSEGYVHEYDEPYWEARVLNEA
jgi:hypothetical protein